MSILVPVEEELKFQKKLKDKALEEINNQYGDINNPEKFNVSSLADILGLLPSGVSILIDKDIWPINTGIRVCKALGLHITIDIGKQR